MKKGKAHRVKDKVNNHRLRLMRIRALRGHAAYTIEQVRELNIQSSKVFDENISGIFPLIIHLVASGLSINKIEQTLNLPPHLLRKWVERNARLAPYIREARIFYKSHSKYKDLDE